MIEVCSLASGSNGNCFFVRTGDERFLVDAGISCRQICLRLEEIGSHAEEIGAIFITHEHSDHVRGLRVLLKRFPVPVYVSEKTYSRINLDIDDRYLRLIRSRDTVSINGTAVQSLPKSHDAVDPALFCFYYGDKKVAVVTDAGYACENVIEAVRDAHVVFLETNYDEDMLKNGFYPYYLKTRIAGNNGHLSNLHAAQLISRHASARLSHVFLSHLSENNNHPELALSTFLSVIEERDDLGHLKTLLTSRKAVSPVVRIES
jgi:phosphoribosyl 1,2-cyclic phosphodiesterase